MIRWIWTEEQYVAELARVALDHIVEHERPRGLKWCAGGPTRADGVRQAWCPPPRLPPACTGGLFMTKKSDSPRRSTSGLADLTMEQGTSATGVTLWS